MTEKNAKPTKEVLEKLIIEKGYKYTGAQYGVSDNTARRWAMAYGIDLKPRCNLTSRTRQGYKMINGRFVYDKYLFQRKTNPYKKKAVDGIKPVIDLKKHKNRYSQSELEVFRKLVDSKIQEGFESICALKDSLGRVGNGTDDTASSGNVFEEGSESIERENMTELVAKKQKHLNALSVALQRIGNGTYGICMVTGNLIPKERLMAVPHATKCIEAKTDSDNGKVITPVVESEGGDDEK